jgi:hypothetical protein
MHDAPGGSVQSVSGWYYSVHVHVCAHVWTAVAHAINTANTLITAHMSEAVLSAC